MKKFYLMTLALIIMGAATASAQKTAVKPAKEAQQVGWVNLITNGNLEGTDNSCFFTKVNVGDLAGEVVNSTIEDGVGVNGTCGIKVAAGDKVDNPWDNQFWFRFTETVPAGTKYRVKFDYRADEDATIGTQAHAEPSDYIHYEMLGNIDFFSDWNSFELEGEVSSSQAGPNDRGGLFQSIAFNLNDDTHPEANSYYFDNIVFEIYRVGTEVHFAQDATKNIKVFLREE